MNTIRHRTAVSKYWQERREFLDYPIQEGFWEKLNKVAAEKNIETMREFLQKVPFHEIGTIKILKGFEKGAGKILSGMETRVFVNWLVYYQCYKVADPSYLPVIRYIKLMRLSPL